MSISMLLVYGMLLIGVGLGVCSLVLSSSRLFNWLVIVENMNVLLLFCSLLMSIADVRVFFVALMVFFAIEVVLCLATLVRLWDFGGFVGYLGY